MWVRVSGGVGVSVRLKEGEDVAVEAVGEAVAVGVLLKVRVRASLAERVGLGLRVTLPVGVAATEREAVWVRLPLWEGLAGVTVVVYMRLEEAVGVGEVAEGVTLRLRREAETEREGLAVEVGLVDSVSPRL